MVDLHAQIEELRDELDAAIAAVLDSGAFVRGPFVAQLEDELGTLFGGAQTIGVGNGTDALQLAFMATGIGAGDEIIVPAFTIFATAEAAMLLGARPVFVDIDPRTFNIDTELIEAAITEKTKAIVPVHLFGQAADMDPILDIAGRHNLSVIEDAAQAIGAKYKNQIVGTLGDIGCLSFYPTKNLSAIGDGGACISRDDELAATLRKLANHGADRKYFNELVGINSRLDGLQAAILSVKLPYLKEWTRARQAAADLYDEVLSETDFVTVPARAPYADHVFHQYTVRVPTEFRDDLAAHLRARGIPTMVYYPVPLHRLPVFSDAAYSDCVLPEAERASQEVLSLPMHPYLSEEQIQYVGQTITAFEPASVSVTF